MIKLGLFQGCKDSSIYANQSMWYTILANWKIKAMIISIGAEKAFDKIQHPFMIQFSSGQSLSRVQLFATLWITARQASLSITSSQSSLKLMCIESVMLSSHLSLCLPLLLLPPTPPSIRVFFNESTLCMRWPKYWSFSFSISPSNEQPRLISFRMDWLDLPAVQGTLKSLLQHHSSNASIKCLVIVKNYAISLTPQSNLL